MNTASHYRRVAALAAVALAFALPLAACQTTVPRSTSELRDVAPAPEPTAPPTRTTPIPTPDVPVEAPPTPGSPAWRSYAYHLCAEHLVAEGVASIEFARMYCAGESATLPH